MFTPVVFYILLFFAVLILCRYMTSHGVWSFPVVSVYCLFYCWFELSSLLIHCLSFQLSVCPSGEEEYKFNIVWWCMIVNGGLFGTFDIPLHSVWIWCDFCSVSVCSIWIYIINKDWQTTAIYEDWQTMAIYEDWQTIAIYVILIMIYESCHLRDMIHKSGSQRASDETALRCNNINIFISKLKTFLFTQA